MNVKTIAAIAAILVLGMEVSAAVTATRLDSIVRRLTKLADDEAAFWFRHGPDPSGGIYGLIEEDGTHSSSEPKGLVQQSRFLWTFSTWYEMGYKTPEVQSLCDNLYNFITKKMSLGSSGDFAFEVSADGKQITNSNRSCYAEAFAVYGLSQYGRVFKNQAALDRAMSCYKAIINRAWDTEYLGVDLTKDDAARSKPKETNTHIHVMEAFTALYVATKNDDVKAKLKDMVDCLCNKIIQPSGYCHILFNRDWSPYGSPLVSYGHDIETSWLMLESAEALGAMKDSLILKKSMAIAKTSSREGFEKSTGCFFLEGVPHGAVTNSSRVWWPQNEGLAGHWWLYKLTKDTTYLDRLEAGISWIENKQISKSCKVCYWAVDVNGKATGTTGTTIGSFWKASYHSMRSYMFVRDWAQHEIASASGRPQVGSGVNPDAGRWNASYAPRLQRVRLEFPATGGRAVAIRIVTPAGRCILNETEFSIPGNSTSLSFSVPVAMLSRQYMIAEVSADNRTRVFRLPFCK